MSEATINPSHVAAARLKVKIAERRGVEPPSWVRDLAETRTNARSVASAPSGLWQRDDAAGATQDQTSPAVSVAGEIVIARQTSQPSETD